ncbi:hypothetical protein [Mucilaginibacter flavus]|nr:hypothetical protein [Mucilaginibacter flavus]
MSKGEKKKKDINQVAKFIVDKATEDKNTKQASTNMCVSSNKK